MGRRQILASALRAIATALETLPAPASETPKLRRVVITDAPGRDTPPEPFEAPDEGVDRVNALLGALYLREAMKRYSPKTETFYA
jgi:hypothetical protein